MRLALGLSTLLVLTGVAHAAPPSATQKNEFYGVCMSIASNESLCSCKAEAAMELIDSQFMTLVISAMKGETYPADEQGTYDRYIQQSNAVCIPGY
jgi:hypothetical protein